MSILGRLSRMRRTVLSSLHLDLFAPPRDEARAPASRRRQPVRSAVTAGSPDAALPSIDALYQLFDDFNVEYFGGRLPRVTIQYSSRMRCAGSYTPSHRLLQIGRKYHLLYPDDIADTLKHEMIHIVNPTHNRAFKLEAARIGASLKAKFHPSLRLPSRFVYECPACRVEYPRRRRLVMSSCGRCSQAGRFDSRYKLRLKRAIKSAA